MPLLINLRHLERQDLSLQGELTAEDLDLVKLDDLMHFSGPLTYDLAAQHMEGGVLVQGRLAVTLDCECSRCLKPFKLKLEVVDWACHLPLTGTETAVVTNDCVDLTPYVREDILLELPQHPLCKPDCGGLKKPTAGKSKKSGTSDAKTSSAWAELDKLKFRKE